MAAADNVALIQRFYDEGWNANNLDVYDELVTDDFLDHQALPGLEPGREGFKMLNVMFRSAFHDVWVTVDQIVADDDTVACRWTSTGRCSPTSRSRTRTPASTWTTTCSTSPRRRTRWRPTTRRGSRRAT